MKKINTMTIFGTRPEVIKLAPVIKKLDEAPNFESILVTTGQHREMLGQALGQFDITPHYNLDIMQANQGVSDVTVNSLIGIEELITQEQPDLVIVQGDTTTAFAGCLAAFYQKKPVAHVEAGLRTYDKYRPFPEEINRSMITQLADLHFVPTATAWEALRSEGIAEDRIFITGNTVIDALFHVLKKNYQYNNEVLRDMKTDGRRLIVVTSHRRENFGQPILDICDSIARLVTEFPDIEVVFSVHRNPKVNVPVREKLSHLDRCHLVDPLDYADMANLIAKSYMVLTDSGGLQEEAPALAKPVLVMRDVTERPEAVQAGMARMVGTSPEAIFASAAELLNNSVTYTSMSQGISPYGDGLAASRIVEAIEFVNGIHTSRPASFVSHVAISHSGDQMVGQPLTNELFYRQLDERIKRAKQERERVSVATINLEQTGRDEFAHAVRTITRSLRKTDTAAALEGKHLVLVLPGATEKQARMTTDRLIKGLSAPSLSRRATDMEHKIKFADVLNTLSVEIKTYEGEDVINSAASDEADSYSDVLSSVDGV
ncbi:MAG: non-hydrolyzing UDP-N-acetylglucosamine 2-epimerase [Thermoleophilia bacterium]